MGVDPFDTAASPEPDPEKALALAVIQRAILDHVAPTVMSMVDTRDAKLFLLGGGPWAASRRAWCEVADIDEGWLQRRLRSIIAGEAQIDTGKRGPKPRLQAQDASRRWDVDEIIAFLRAEGHMPWPVSSKAPLARILNGAGYRGPRGGLVTTDTVWWVMRRRPEAFACLMP